MFVGRDGVVHDHLADIEHERRTNYSYLGPYARDLLETRLSRLEKEMGRPTVKPAMTRRSAVSTTRCDPE